jgi:F-type H+-transporting ATPase subunit a
MFNLFAASDIHVSLKAEPIFKLGPLTVNNSLIFGLICAVIILALFITAAYKIKYRPGKSKLANGVEYLVNFVLDMLTGSLGSRALAVRYAPFFISIFCVIITSYLLSLIPLVGPGIYANVEGAHTPLLRAFTADINTTLAMAIIAIVAVQIMSISVQGGKKHLQHYFTDKPFNPLNFLIGVIEIFGEFTRIISLALRLFLNTAVGEILIAVFTSLVLSGGRTPLAVAPIFLFEILVAGIQAYVFTVLSATYLGLAVSHAHDDPHSDHQKPVNKDTMVEARQLVKEPLH